MNLLSGNVNKNKRDAFTDSPLLDRHRCSPGATGGNPRTSSGPCWAEVAAARHPLPEDKAVEWWSGTPTLEPTWGRSDSRVAPAVAPHGDLVPRRSVPPCGQGPESIHPSSSTSHRRTHEVNKCATLSSLFRHNRRLFYVATLRSGRLGHTADVRQRATVVALPLKLSFFLPETIRRFIDNKV